MLNEVFIAGSIQTELREITAKGAVGKFSFRLKVPKESGGSDSIVCVIDDEGLIELLATIELGDEISIAGRLQSRFFRSGSSGASITEVKVEDLILVD